MTEGVFADFVGVSFDRSSWPDVRQAIEPSLQVIGAQVDYDQGEEVPRHVAEGEPEDDEACDRHDGFFADGRGVEALQPAHLNSEECGAWNS